MDLETLLPLLVAVVCAWLLWVQFRPLLLARRMRGQPVPAPGDPNARAQLYYFWSPHCGHCRSMNAVVERLREQGEAVVKINVLEDRKLARDFGVAATPSLVLVRDGRIADILLGARTETQILRLLGGQ